MLNRQTVQSVPGLSLSDSWDGLNHYPHNPEMDQQLGKWMDFDD